MNLYSASHDDDTKPSLLYKLRDPLGGTCNPHQRCCTYLTLLLQQGLADIGSSLQPAADIAFTFHLGDAYEETWVEP